MFIYLRLWDVEQDDEFDLRMFVLYFVPKLNSMIDKKKQIYFQKFSYIVDTS